MTARVRGFEPARGEGPGEITRDGCAVDIYLKLPYRGELETLAEHLPPGCSVLDLGCGTGRLSRRLLDKGHPVTAVDHSPEMLRHVPDAATKVCSSIEDLSLDRRFDVALLASNLINTGDASMRRAQLAACRRHLSPGGVLLFQRFDPVFFRDLQPGPFPSIGEVEIEIERAEHHGDFVDVTLRYAMGEAVWRQRFTAQILDDDDIRQALGEAGFGEVHWVEKRWGAARLLPADGGSIQMEAR